MWTPTSAVQRPARIAVRLCFRISFVILRFESPPYVSPRPKRKRHWRAKAPASGTRLTPKNTRFPERKSFTALPGRGGRAARGEGRTSRRGAEHAEKAKTGEGEKPLRSMKSSQADKISNVCKATKDKSRRSNLVPLSFSACSAPLREILFVFAGGVTKRARLAEKSPGRMSPRSRSRRVPCPLGLRTNRRCGPLGACVPGLRFRRQRFLPPRGRR